MNTTRDESPRELPGPPSHRSANVQYSGASIDEASFRSIFRDYIGTEHFEDALKVYLTKSLNKEVTSGVNTWHTQVLAGRITLEDLKVMGYKRLAKQRVNTTDILIALTRDKDPMTAEEMRIALIAAERSLMFGDNPPLQLPPVQSLTATMFFAGEYGKYSEPLRYHADIQRIAGIALNSLVKKEHTKSLEMALYVDNFFAALQEYIPPRKTVLYNERHYPVRYKNYDFLKLMEARMTPEQAAKAMMHSLSVDRAIEAKDLPDALMDGAL